MDNHHDVSKHLGPAQKRGGVQPVSGDAPQGRSRAGAFDSPHDHPKNSFPVLSSDAASWEPGGAEVEPSRSGGKATCLMAVGLSGLGVVALFASATLGWRSRPRLASC
jgi:hypothetical protein